MQSAKHIIVYSHGFGVKKDDRGLLTDIAVSLPEAESILFDYFEIDENKKTLTIRPLSAQAEILNNIVAEKRKSNPDAIIDLICHSQGTIVSAIAKPNGVRRVVLLAPVFDMTLERTFKRYAGRDNVEINRNGISKIGVLDGYLRFVPKEYWDEREHLNTFKEYNSFAELAELFIVEANQDTIVPKVDTSPLNPRIKQISMDGDHGFTGLARAPLIAMIRKLLLD